MRHTLVLVTVLAFAGMTFAGCLDTDPSNPKANPREPAKKSAGALAGVSAGEAGRFLAHTAALNEIIDPAAVYPVLPTVSYVSVGRRGPEPSIGVTNNGMIFFQAIAGGTGVAQGVPGGPATMRSDDGGVTWKDVSRSPFTSPTTLDPFLWVDQTTNRVYVNHLYLACSYLSWSDDYGATWVANPIACGIPVNDHQKITTGPFRAPLTATPAYKNVLYYGYNAIAGGSRVSISFDGGFTFPVNTQMVPPGTCSGGLHGRLHAGPDGYMYLPKRDCPGPIVGISADNGLTWTNVPVGRDVGSAAFRKNPEIAVDNKNNVYLVWPGRDNRLYLSVSTDHGKTWSERSMLASPIEVTTTTMPSIVAGDEGRIAFAYYGVYQGNGEQPECVGNDETWDVYVTWSVNALDDNPLFVTSRANALDDPVQIGGISTNSGAPEASKNCQYRRNLLDFIDMAMDKEGRVYVATADGCIKCENQQSSNGSDGIASIQLTGPSLLSSVPDFEAPPKGVSS